MIHGYSVLPIQWIPLDRVLLKEVRRHLGICPTSHIYTVDLLLSYQSVYHTIALTDHNNVRVIFSKLSATGTELDHL